MDSEKNTEKNGEADEISKSKDCVKLNLSSEKKEKESEEEKNARIRDKLELLCKSKLSGILNKNVVSVTDETSFMEFADLLERYEYKGVPVVNEKNKLVGIVTWSDMIKLLLFYGSYGTKIMELESFTGVTSIRAIRSDNVITLSPDDTIEDAAHLMFENNIQTIPIVKKDEVVGIVGKKDIIREIIRVIEEVKDV